MSDAWSLFYKCMDLAVQDPTKLQVLLSSMISVEHEIHDIGGEPASNTATNLQTCFGCAVLEHIKIHPPPRFVTKGRGKTMKARVKRITEQ